MAFLTLRDGTKIFYTDEGTGPIALMLHGWACDGNDWAWQMPALRERHRVVVIDHRGHGRSDAPEGLYDPETLADDAAQVLAAVAPGQQASVVGHSMGGVIACALAASHPGLVSALVLVDPAFPLSDENLSALTGGMRHADPHRVAGGVFASFYDAETPLFLRAWHERRVAGTPAHVVAGCILGLYEAADAIGRRANAGALLSRRRVPSLVLVATAQGAELFAGIEVAVPGDEIRVVAAGHFLHQQAAPEVNAIITTWLGARLADVAADARTDAPG
jgi:pimeloyl-ACP methyl ester carboxylesterase